MNFCLLWKELKMEKSTEKRRGEDEGEEEAKEDSEGEEGEEGWICCLSPAFCKHLVPQVYNSLLLKGQK